MTVKELNIGDVFRVVGEEQLWRKKSLSAARRLGDLTGLGYRDRERDLRDFSDKKIEVVERAGEICRAENTLILRGGEVVLEYLHPLLVHQCTQGDPLTEFVLSGATFTASVVERPTVETVLRFSIARGSNHLNRPAGSDVLAFKGRVYGRATKKEVLGKAAYGGHHFGRVVDGVKRIVIAGLLTIPSEFALYDIMMEHFGSDTVPRA